jgi:hypothetical protein
VNFTSLILVLSHVSLAALESPAQPKYAVGTDKINKNIVVADSSMYVNT